MDTAECLSKLFPHPKHSFWPCECGTEERSYCGLDFLYYKHWCSGDESKGMKRSSHTFQMAVFCTFLAFISNIRKVTSWSFNLQIVWRYWHVHFPTSIVFFICQSPCFVHMLTHGLSPITFYKVVIGDLSHM